ncbi:Zn-ribbon domain-containing OB-fold protein [Allopusillimonas ginsengisoli]|uniref:Zn-ribbon domain-containing OB-fold protein n=1 Tax=Allopusillimonas ginsengisoli TaxID=453575 RepID=UPI001021C01D|nr:OB-fold domain-containing protein [Allopusillimonas ginsengisoli]TEA78915.1 hypothetical protein ERE07_05825 [Allopusillimonas ginsengisoli]
MDRDNRTYLEGWKNGSLMLQQCAGCHAMIFYPRPMCPHCWSDSLSWIKASGRGRVVSYSMIHRPNHPSFNDETPIALAEIVLEEGPTLLARVLSQDVKSGMAVELANDPESVARYPLPIFRPRLSE